MTKMKAVVGILLLAFLGTLMACSGNAPKSPDVADNIRKGLDDAGLKSVSVSQDRDKGVVTLTGHVAAEGDKAQAANIANSAAAGQVVANEIAVVPPGDRSDARTVDSDLDKGIDKNVDAALIQNRLQHGVRYDVKNGVVTLNGSVSSQSARAQVEHVVSGVPNVQQVVNEIQIKDQKATSTTTQ